MTTLERIGGPSALLNLGAEWSLAFVTFDVNGVRSNAVTPVVTVTRPDASTVAPVPTYQGYGIWEAVYAVAASGRHLAHVSTTEDALDFAAYVGMPVTESGMPTATDASVYLGQNAGTWSMAEIAGALAAERTAQRDRCGERAIYPDSLREALLRRVQRNLALRRLPLAMAGGDSDVGPTVIPGRDPEVRRLEAPYRKRVVG